MQNESNPDYKGNQILSEIDANLVNYSNHIVELFFKSASSLGVASSTVLDFGAGQGTLAELWREKTGVSPECAELDPELLSVLQAKGFLAHQFMADIPSSFNFIYSSNVLEHIELDVEALRNLASKLNDGGLFAIYVPAFPILFSNLDTSVGHFRRYRKSELKEKVSLAGFSVVRSEYSDCFGFLATLFLKSFGFAFSPTRKTKVLMKIYDRFIVPVSIFLDRVGFKYLLGKNLFFVVKLKSTN